MRKEFAQRIRFLSVLVILGFLIIIVRLYAVQIVYGDEYELKADRQYIEPSSGVFDRGRIYFADKDGLNNNVPAATNQSGFLLAINPQKIDDMEATYASLASVVPLDKENFIARASRVDDPYEVVANRITEDVANKITDLELTGVSLHPERWRYYPADERSAHVLGFLGYQDNEYAGRYGIESEYEEVLQRDSEVLNINFFAQTFSNLRDLVESDTHEGSGDIYLTIEPFVQSALEEELREVTDRWDASGAGGVVINPNTGAIYAMAAHPTFDINHFGKVDDISIFINPLVQNVFEMGSIIKTLTMSAGLDTGAVVPESTYYDAGFVELDNGYATVTNYDGEGRGTVAMTQVLGESLNTGAVYVQQRTGNSVFADYMHKFGLGEETGIDLPGEVTGKLSNLESPRDVEYATAAFGQGISLTPIATARALSALANGGTLVTPHVVEKIEYDFKPAFTFEYREGRRVLKKETSETITKMLVDVVDEYLVGGTVDLEHYTIAAKTGTAQIPGPGGEYLENTFFHSFFGYFPAYNPQFLILLYVERPYGVRYASQTLTDPFMSLTTSLISYYDIPPDR